MSPTALFIYVCLFGLLGVAARYSFNFWKREAHGVIVSTMIVNLVGSLIIGLMWELWQRKKIPHEWYIITCAGFLGGLTTFSGYALNLAQLTGYESTNGFQIASFLLYAFIAPFAGTVAVVLGITLGRLLD